jgi:hypothetical protein
MNEAQARQVVTDQDAGHDVSWQDCKDADRWIKAYALEKFEKGLMQYGLPNTLREYLLTCASLHFGSVETDNMLMSLDCYPEWLRR